MTEYVVISADPFFKTESLQDTAQLAEVLMCIGMCIGNSPQNSIHRFLKRGNWPTLAQNG